MVISKSIVKWFTLLYSFLIACFFLYSFTQVDLNLTLSRASFYQTAEKFFQYIGYFNRPLSATIFFALITLLYACYILLLSCARNNIVTKKTVWVFIIVTVILLVFSYNAFSYDIFNYIFDAKIFTFYHQNPYVHRALDFPDDKMLHFMRWTHRTYPYGPLWLILTVPLSFIGGQIFLVTFFLFKFLMAGSYVGTCYLIQKISVKFSPKNALINLVFFAFNPLVIVESLISAHMDIVMMFFAITAFWLLLQQKKLLSGLLLVCSIATKFATIFLLPVFIYVIIKKERISIESLSLIISSLMAIAVIFESYWSGNFQPWYLLAVLPFASFSAKKYYIVIPTICMTFCALLEYLPYIYLGNWNPPVPNILLNLTIVGILSSVICSFVYKRITIK